MKSLSVETDATIYGGINSVAVIDFNTTGTASAAKGRIKWNPTDETFDMGMANGVNLQVGQEMYIRGRNNHGVLIPNGTAVYISGTDSTVDLPEILPFIANGSVDPLLIIGVTTQDIANGATGYVTTYGFVRDLNTTGSSVGQTWVAGDRLWASSASAGYFTNVQPTAPNAPLPMGTIITCSASVGSILVFARPVNRQYYGTFSRTISASATTASTAYAIAYDTVDEASGFSVAASAPSQIWCNHTGRFTIDFSLQITSASGNTEKIWIWPRINGVDVPNSNTRISIASNKDDLVPAWNFQLTLQKNQYFELMWATSNTGVLVTAIPSNSFSPAIPSAIVTFAQVND
jgi:hypothetical protein